jgi:predicted acetyltransferase
MHLSDEYDEVPPEKVTLVEGIGGYQILVDGEYAGAIEGVPGKLHDFVVEMHWREKGVGRAALQKFVEFSAECWKSEVVTNNVMHDAMEHILETEGFEPRDEMGWKKPLSENTKSD